MLRKTHNQQPHKTIFSLSCRNFFHSVTHIFVNVPTKNRHRNPQPTLSQITVFTLGLLETLHNWVRHIDYTWYATNYHTTNNERNEEQINEDIVKAEAKGSYVR